jgi:hypothetical protein
VIHLGLTADEFWDMTPRAIKAMWAAYEEREIRTDARFAAILEWIARAHLTKPGSEKWKPGELVPAVAWARHNAKELVNGKPRKRITTPEEAVLLYQQSSEEALNEMLNFTAVHNANLAKKGGRK